MLPLASFFSDIEFWKIALPAGGAIAAWVFNERSKAKSMQLEKKEACYRALVSSISGFGDATPDPSKVQDFITHLDLCWLYASDEVINAAYDFAQLVHTDTGMAVSSKDRIDRIGRLVLAIRRDMLSRNLVERTDLRSDRWAMLVALPKAITAT